MIKFQRIQIRRTCRGCDGTGKKTFEVSMHEFMDIVNSSLREGNKLVAIKDVRTRWDLGLRDAKELVESYQTFLAAMPDSNVKWDRDTFVTEDSNG
tara:strand:+ start:7422 stop:7709 length:288 start_codon:yes stop_codon:yes gene_type:complete